uniref:Reverse transcriptase domain-containing protein n=1 Tax=Tanacetum cinerariifolium TaxID=118510 RepID=A0A6L2KWK7_TANCI|nr:hypothetical protein [Tanacetum cinerariifolium]
MDQNIDSSGFDQIQSPQYPVIHHPSQADVEEVLHDKEKFMQDTQTFLEKFNRFSFKFTPRVLTIAWERIYKIKYVFTELEEIPKLMYKLREDVGNIREEEYLEKFPDAVTTEIIKSGVEELVPIPKEYEVTSEDKNECDVPDCEDSSTFDVCDDHSEILSDSNDDDISSNDDAFEDIEYVEASLPVPKFVSLEEENVEEEEFNLDDIQDVILREKLLSINRLIANIESLNPTPDRMLNSSTSIPIFEESDSSLSDNFSLEFKTFSDYMEETKSGITTTHANNSLPEYASFCFEIEPDQESLTSVIMKNISDDSTNDPLMEEVDLFLALDNSIPSGIENFGYDSEVDIHFLEKLLVNDSIPLLENESFYFDHQDNLLFPRPPPEPPDVEFLFDLEPNSGEVISAVMNNIEELNEENCFDTGEEIDILVNVADGDYFSFIFVIRIFLPYLIYPEVSPLLLSAKSEDTIFDPGIFV